MWAGNKALKFGFSENDYLFQSVVIIIFDCIEIDIHNTARPTVVS